ncbi:MAG: hypothetical protein PHX01_06315 [Clostridia bacterium]|nr:hypothetical protein [Clostridia bacterium]
MKKNMLLILFIFFFVLTGILPHPTKAITSSLAGTDIPQNFAPEIFPLHKTKIELHDQKITLDWSEKTTTVNGIYHLINPEEKKIKLKIGLCLPPPEKNKINSSETNFTEINSSLKAFCNGEEIQTTYNEKFKGYVWGIKLEPQEEIILKLNYTLQNKTNEQGLCEIGYQFSPMETIFPLGESPRFSLILNFLDTHPGQIINLKPYNYTFRENSLVWKENNLKLDEREAIIITANLEEENKSWTDLLSPKEKKRLLALTSQAQYYEAISLLENKYPNITKTEDKQALLLGQAYYLKKAGKTKKAFNLFADLVNNDAPYPRAYWELGKSYEQHTGKLTGLFNQIQELQIHALLQPWLVAKLPPEKVKLSSPEITIKYADTNESRQGILIKSYLIDKDGDITKIMLRYHWEGEQKEEINFPVHPFQYDYDLLYFTLAPDSFKRLFYEFIVTDSAGHEVSSGIKEAFYLNEEIQSNTFILEGANLILGDYTAEEQNKVHKWFKSYLKMAKEAGFVPVEAKSPLFIFLGQKHDFFKNYQGPLFVYHTLVPFNPDETRIPAHRYFLSYWYGPGWHTLPLNELAPLGDALLLNKGWHAQIFTYLQNKDHQLFAKLLCEIGAGKNWAEALNTTYQLTPLKLNFLTIWHFVGNYVLAIILIVLFAWLSKNGHLTKLIQYFKTTK